MNRSPQADSSASERRRQIICVGDPSGISAGIDQFELVVAKDAYEAVDFLQHAEAEGLWVSRDHLPVASEVQGVCHSGAMLRDMPEGVALLDSDLRVLWANMRLKQWAVEADDKVDDVESISVGQDFYELLGTPEIMGPDFCPFHTALATGDESSSTLHTEHNRFYQVHAAPMMYAGATRHLIVTVGDVSEEILQQQKLAKIHRAGRELADLRPSEIHMMDVEDRIVLLKDNIRHYLSDLMNFDLIELRLLEHMTGNLVPLLSVGIDQEAADRQLYAQPHGNGITGYAAASGMSYICHDVINDPLFIPGVANSRSSLTVPLILHDQILGTINVESPEPAAFSDSDMQFLEIFARDVAFALNTLELLVAQKADAAQQSCDAIHSAVAIRVDEILNDAVNVMEGYIGHGGEVVDRLRRVLQNTRDIKQTIQQIGQKMTPVEAIPAGGRSSGDAILKGKRVLVVDEDENVRKDAHTLLDRYGCIVETAHRADEAVLMVRGAGEAGSYDAIISDIKLPDVSGYQLMLRLGKIMDRVPMILMTGFGYDPGHSIVNARQAGLHPKAVLFKPFRLDQLINVLETVLLLDPKNQDDQKKTSDESVGNQAADLPTQ